MEILPHIPKDYFEKHRLILVCGSGGVGKTTTAATLALKAALEGYKSLVLTIDPAKRLATSLGVGELTGTPRKIDFGGLEMKSGSYHMEAMMLDPKSTFDDLVIRYSPSKEIEKKILGNDIYQHLSQMIAGSQEYMAIEKLYEVVKNEKFDVIVVDTPPTTHAIDFLEAPQKMVNAVSHSMINMLLKPALFMGKSGMKILGKGSQMLMKVLDRITGFEFLQDISEMLLSFQSLLGGFETRAGEVKEILLDPKTSFLLVSACQEQSVKEAKMFSERMGESGYVLDGVIMNRVHPFYDKAQEQEGVLKPQLKAEVGKPLAEKMAAIFEEGQIMGQLDLKHIKKVQNDVKKAQFMLLIPLFESDIHDLSGLHRLSKHL